MEERNSLGLLLEGLWVSSQQVTLKPTLFLYVWKISLTLFFHLPFSVLLFASIFTLISSHKSLLLSFSRKWWMAPQLAHFTLLLPNSCNRKTSEQIYSSACVLWAEFCVPLKCINWSPNPQSGDAWRWGLWEVVRFRWIDQVHHRWIGSGELIKEHNFLARHNFLWMNLYQDLIVRKIWVSLLGS